MPVAPLWSAMILFTLTALLGGASQPPKRDPAMLSKPKAATPLLADWTGRWGGVPPCGGFQVADLKPALDAAMAESLEEIEQIAANPSRATFDNTIAAMDRAGHALDRVAAIYGVYTSTMNDAQVQSIESEFEPKLAAFNDRIVQNVRLFARIAAVYSGRDSMALNPEQQRLLWLRYTRFVRPRPNLDDAPKSHLPEPTHRLADLDTKFPQDEHGEESHQHAPLHSGGEQDG